MDGCRPSTTHTTHLSLLCSMRFFASATLAMAMKTSSLVRALSSSTISGPRRLGNTDLVVSEACLGSMTFGVQNNQEEAFSQLDYARQQGVNFIDTAELYPVPLTAPDWRPGATEEIIGAYVDKIGASARNELVIASKVAGYFPSSPVAAARYENIPSEPIDGRLDALSVKTACEASLKRLRTDRIDLYQVHWPDRYLPVFGQTEFRHNMKREDDVSIEETASALRDLIEEGKVRYIGISNESSFGVSQWVQACKKLGIQDKLASIQNSYSLLDRRFDSELAEICDAYEIGLLPWSILAGGLLSGKYQSGKSPTKSSRFIKYPEYMSRWSPVSARPETLAAVDDYVEIAKAAGMSPSELAIAFIRSRPFVSNYGSTIVGATTMEQLKENLAPFATDNVLDDDVLEAINKVHLKCRDPSCAL